MADTVDNDNAENIANEAEHAMESVIGAFNPINNKLNWLLIALPLAVFFNFQGDLTMAFLFLE